MDFKNPKIMRLIFNLSILFIMTSCNIHKKKLVWSDEFNIDGRPSVEKWNFERGLVRNQEKQFYTNRSENVRVENGNLIIQAHKKIEADTVIYTSASLTTLNKKSWTYGRFEVRAKIPTGVGAWPAIWFLGENIDKTNWPLCGEIDLLENVGFDPEIIHANVHTQAYNHRLKTNKGNTIKIEKPYEDFHIYTLDWTEKRIEFYVDNKLYFTFENDKKGNIETWPFSQPFYLLINLAVGGSWGGEKGIDDSIFPLTYEIDYVRVYQ